MSLAELLFNLPVRGEGERHAIVMPMYIGKQELKMIGYFVKPGRAVILACAENLDRESGRIISDWGKESGRLISDGFSQVDVDEYDIVYLVEVYGAARVIEIATKYAEIES